MLMAFSWHHSMQSYTCAGWDLGKGILAGFCEGKSEVNVYCLPGQKTLDLRLRKIVKFFQDHSKNVFPQQTQFYRRGFLHALSVSFN